MLVLVTRSNRGACYNLSYIKNMKASFLKIFTLVSYLAMVVINYLAVTLPLAGRDTAAISDSYPNLFAPAGYAFSIWGLIYTLLGIYTIYQFSKKENHIDKINNFFIVSSWLNFAWIFSWHYDLIWLSVLLMIGILVCLIKINDIFLETDLTKKEKWLVQLPFSVYFGWITVATIANVTTFLVSIGWNGFGYSESFWTILVLFAGVFIGCIRMMKDRFIAYGLVLIWAYGAILFKHTSNTGFAGQYPGVILASQISIFIFAVTIIYITFNHFKINRKIKS